MDDLIPFVWDWQSFIPPSCNLTAVCSQSHLCLDYQLTSSIIVFSSNIFMIPNFGNNRISFHEDGKPISIAKLIDTGFLVP